MSIKGIASLGIFILVFGCSDSNADSYTGTSPALRTNAERYRPGDSIIIIAELHGPASIRVYERLRQSLSIIISLKEAYQGTVANTYDGVKELAAKVPSGAIRAIEIQDREQFVISGTISRSRDGKSLVLDFPEYGSQYLIERDALCKSIGLGISGYWKPIRPSSLDSLEDYTNQIVFKPEDLGEDSCKTHK